MERFDLSPPPRTARRARLAAIASVAVGLAMSSHAWSAERRTISNNGETVRIDAPTIAQQRISGTPNPFATTAQRAAVKPLAWDTSARDPAPAPARGKPTISRPEHSVGGLAPSFGDYMARKSFPEAWKTVDETAAQERASRSAVPDASTKDGAHYGWSRFLGNYHTSQWTVPPWNKIGKLYFNVPGGGSSYCTASVASGNSVILTAAHCVYSRGAGWNYNFVFVPADRYGAAPYGSYGYQSATILTDWINIGGRRHDVAAIKLTGEVSTGIPVVNYVGWLGRSWDWPYEQWTYSHGYASNFSTDYTNVCAGWTFYAPSEGTDVLVQGCDMTYGSSGGPWLREFIHDSHAGNSVNSVVSGPHIGAFGTYYVGARFSSSNIVPICNAIGC